MQSIQDVLRSSLPQNKKLSSTKSTGMAGTTDEPFDYWAWYYSPGNTIRAWDEEHGVKLMQDKTTGIPRFEADRNVLFENDKPAQTYPDYFKDRILERFVVNLYSFGANQDTARKALNMTTRYIDNYDRIVNEYGGGGLYYFSHERGSGKTFLSTILGNELTQRGHRVRWYNMTNLIQEIKAGFDRESSMSSSDVIDRARDAEILILDDIGAEKQSAWLNETVYSILDRRMSECKPTIFTSNHTPEELSYDERIIDRISRMTELVRMPEESIRRKLNSRNRFGAFLEEVNA